MDKSILTDIKSLLGAGNIDGFDSDIIMHINSVLAVLRQLGVGPTSGFAITGTNETWEDLLGDNSNPELLHNVKSYIFLKVKMIFDPPTSGTVAQAYKELISELEWRLNVTVDPDEE